MLLQEVQQTLAPTPGLHNFFPRKIPDNQSSLVPASDWHFANHVQRKLKNYQPPRFRSYVWTNTQIRLRAGSLAEYPKPSQLCAPSLKYRVGSRPTPP